MCCGVPSIVQNNSSLRELVGSCGIVMPDFNLKEWEQNCIKILTDKKIWEKLHQECINRSKNFSRITYINNILKVYQLAMDEHG